MPYTLVGTLKLPETNKPAAGVILTFVALASISPVLGRSESSVVTSATGAYSISLEFNTYSVLATLYDNKPLPCGEIVVNSQTTAGLDLPTLLNGGQYEPATPAWILQIQAWVTQASASAAASQQSANASAASASASAASAAQASQISGLDTVAEAIGMAALPLPDVWAPLSDSLRMITGYGREVKVGDDVVARMVNFSRASTATYIGKDGKLKTATANEPRFEKEGLLIEGQSTNTLQNSTAPNTTYQVTKTEDVTAPDGVSVASTFTNTQVANYIRFGVIVPGANTATITGSIWIKAVSGSGQLTAGVDDRGTVTITPTSEWVRYSFTRRGEAASANIIDIRFVAGHNGLKIAVWGAQREVGPIATSLIPTNGPAVTRAGDVCSLPASGNWPNGDFVIAANLSYTKGLAENPILFVSGKDTPTAGFINTLLRDTNVPPDNRLAWYGAPSSFLTTSGALSTAVFRNRSGMRDIVYDGEILSMGEGVQNTAVPAVRIYLGNYSPTQFLNGHIRNLRIWHRTLTDEQIKAVA